MTERELPDYRDFWNDPEKVAEFINGRIDSKLNWYQDNCGKYVGKKWSTWQQKVLEVLYKDNLGIEVPKDGEVVCAKGNTLIIRWRNLCPVLDHCKKLGLSTSHVCSTLYHVQYQWFLSLIVPGAFFARNYSQLRPDGDSCIEVIVRRPDGELLEQAWKLLLCASRTCKPFLWLRDTDSTQRLASDLRSPLKEALETIVLFPQARTALRKKLCSIYDRALEKHLVGIGASPYATREGKRTKEYGLLTAIDYAREHKEEFGRIAEEVCDSGNLDWTNLFDLAEKFIDYLDWDEFVLENSRGQATCLLLECVELLDAAQRQNRNDVQQEIGDVFYNLIAFCLSVRIHARHLGLTSCSSGPAKPRS